MGLCFGKHHARPAPRVPGADERRAVENVAFDAGVDATPSAEMQAAAANQRASISILSNSMDPERSSSTDGNAILETAGIADYHLAVATPLTKGQNMEPGSDSSPGNVSAQRAALKVNGHIDQTDSSGSANTDLSQFDGFGKIRLIKMCREQSLDYKPFLNDVDSLKRLLLARSNSAAAVGAKNASSIIVQTSATATSIRHPLVLPPSAQIATAPAFLESTVPSAQPGATSRHVSDVDHVMQTAVSSEDADADHASAQQVADYHFASATSPSTTTTATTNGMSLRLVSIEVRGSDGAAIMLKVAAQRTAFNQSLAYMRGNGRQLPAALLEQVTEEALETIGTLLSVFMSLVSVHTIQMPTEESYS